MNHKLDIVRVKLVTDQQLLSDTAISNPQDAAKLVAKYLSGFDREVFCALNLNAKGEPINMNIVSIGELTSTLVHPREVFKGSLLSNAAAVIVFHNHPSGDPTPSTEDFKTTKIVEEAGTLLRVKVLDHIVVGNGTNEYYSIMGKQQGRFADDQKSETFTSEDILSAAELENLQYEWQKMKGDIRKTSQTSNCMRRSSKKTSTDHTASSIPSRCQKEPSFPARILADINSTPKRSPAHHRPAFAAFGCQAARILCSLNESNRPIRRGKRKNGASPRMNSKNRLESDITGI